MTQVIVQPNSYQVRVTYEQRTVVVSPLMRRKVVVGIAGPPGPAGTGGFLFNQASAASPWIVNHNLGFRPTIQVYDVGGNIVNAEMIHVSVNQCQIFFVTPFIGFCRCN